MYVLPRLAINEGSGRAREHDGKSFTLNVEHDARVSDGVALRGDGVGECGAVIGEAQIRKQCDDACSNIFLARPASCATCPKTS